MDAPQNGRQGGNGENQDAKQLRSSQTMTTIACLAGPISMIIGGMLLSTIAVVVGALAYRKLGGVASSSASLAQVALSVQKTAKVGIIIGCVAFVLNAISSALLMPELMGMMGSGSASGLFGTGGATDAAVSTWG